MAEGDRRLKTLLDAAKRELTLRFDPSGSRNRCFYRCLAESLDLSEVTVLDMIKAFLLGNRMANCTSVVGVDTHCIVFT